MKETAKSPIDLWASQNQHLPNIEKITWLLNHATEYRSFWAAAKKNLTWYDTHNQMRADNWANTIDLVIKKLGHNEYLKLLESAKGLFKQNSFSVYANAGIPFVAWGAVVALMAYDCAHLLDEKIESIELMAMLGNPAAMLLYPVKWTLDRAVAYPNVTI